MAEQNRASRAANTREDETRRKEWVPPSKRTAVEHGDDYIMRWLRVEYNGQPDHTNMENKLAEGYELVSPDDPAVREKVAKGELKAKDGRVYRGGLVLAKMDRELAEQRNAHYTKEAQLHQQSVDQALERARHRSMPLESDLKRSHGREG